MKIAILGSTGSIGTQTLKVVEELNAAAQTESNPHIEIAALAAGDNVERIARQAACFRVPLLSVATAEGAARLEELLKRTAPELKPEIFYGEEGLLQVAECGAELLVTAIVGMIGLRPTLAAIHRGTDIALANKETLVAAGELVMREAAAHSVRILPVDSEHSAIFQ